MAKFLNKKEQVYDLKLTSYGHYLLSIGKFQPAYYAFYDDNVLYDSGYANSASGSFPGPMSQSVEPQNMIRKRIKEETSYFEGLVLFEEVEDLLAAGESGVNFEVDLVPAQIAPRRDIFKYDNAIGNAYLSALNNQFAPAWKIVALEGVMSSCQFESSGSEIKIPQINIESRYVKKTGKRDYVFDPEIVGDFTNQTIPYFDNQVIKIEPHNVVIYVEEQNTDLLTENFDIEVFETIVHSVATHASGSGTFLQNPTYILAAPQHIHIRTWAGDTGIQFEFMNAADYNSANPEEVEIMTDTLETLAQFVDRVNAHPSMNVTARISSTYSNTFDLVNGVIGTIGNAPGGALINTNAPLVFLLQNWTGATDLKTSLKRKYFQTVEKQVVDGYLTTPDPIIAAHENITSASVEYYFDIFRDTEVDPAQACKGAAVFNKQSYYVNLDFDCQSLEDKANPFYFDIYGKVTDTKICPD